MYKLYDEITMMGNNKKLIIMIFLITSIDDFNFITKNIQNIL